jgi:hypothetical protein
VAPEHSRNRTWWRRPDARLTVERLLDYAPELNAAEMGLL